MQIISAGSSAGVDVGDSTSNEEAVALFAKQKGYKVDTPNVVNDILRVCFLGTMTSKFRSGLEERVADLLSEWG